MKVRAKIVSFNKRTWWGEAVYDLTVVKFHGTCVNGYRTGTTIDKNTPCTLYFNDDGNLFAVRLD